MKDLKYMLDEKRLLHRVVTYKDADSYGKIYDLYVEKMYRFILFKINNREEAEDHTSEVFLKVWHYLISAKGKNIQSLNGLYYRIARNIVIDTYRKRAKEKHVPIDQVEVFTTENIIEKIEVKQEYGLLLEAIKQLKQEYQEVLLLRYIEELAIAEIATIIDKKKSAVRVLLHRATKKLQSIHNV